MPELDRITFDPDILGGRAFIRGMRIPVSLIVNLVADGMTAGEIVAEYPDLEEEDVAQALKYAAWIADDQFLPATETACFGSSWTWASPSPLPSF